jgi:ParB family chromosome partitioning protein
MDPATHSRLRASLRHYGLVVPLVVRRLADDAYETVGGAHRLALLRELGVASAPCVLVQADDTEARLLSQCLNRIAGADNPGLRADLLRQVLAELPQEQVLGLLPETAASLAGLVSLGQQDVADQLRAFQRTQEARLRHLTFHLTADQLAVVHRALAIFPSRRPGSGPSGPNARSDALFRLCQLYLESEESNS